jgi:type IX secretion system PorP/SprF family membrane protein
MRTKILYFGLLVASVLSYAQQDAQYTNYMYNTMNVNPAYTGTRGVLSIFGLHRTQWVGIDGAPVTNTLAVSTPIERTNLGVGLSFVNDRLGPSTENIISGDVSYTVKASTNYKLSFGVKLTANLFDFDVNKLTPESSNSIDNSLESFNNFSPNVGAGVYLHSEKSYVGLSVPNLLENGFKYDANKTNQSVYKERMNFYLIAGHVFDFSDNLKFKPAGLFKAVKGAPLQFDLSGNFLINEKLTLGAAWRWSAAVSALAGFQINPSWFIGYGYDLETTRLRRYNSGSHEIFLRYELFRKTEKIVSPRFF